MLDISIEHSEFKTKRKSRVEVVSPTSLWSTFGTLRVLMPEEMVAMFLKENVQRSTIQKRKPKQKKI
jgi:hypothetical protein